MCDCIITEGNVCVIVLLLHGGQGVEMNVPQQQSPTLQAFLVQRNSALPVLLREEAGVRERGGRRCVVRVC